MVEADAAGSAAEATARLTTRRALLARGASLTGLVLAGAPAAQAAAALTRPRRRYGTPLRHIVVQIQENRSFDHYLGRASFVRAYGFPRGYAVPDGAGGMVAPHPLAAFATPDVAHSWAVVHEAWDRGRMDGFVRAGGRETMGYYRDGALPFLRYLFDHGTLCVNSFCSLLGPTRPNRLYLAAGTAGGGTTNGVGGIGKLDYPCILDLLDARDVSWKVYNLGNADQIDTGSTHNVYVFFRGYVRDRRTRQTQADYLRDAREGTLPNVCFLLPDNRNGKDEHPPADLRVGIHLQVQVLHALQTSPQWPQSAYVLTYDEAGGYFDHVRPPPVDAYGLGVRIPTWVVSPLARRRHLEPTVYDHSSILKLIERTFRLPTLASVNHRFDRATPGGVGNEAAHGRAPGPPAPPRDGLARTGDMTECFTFARRT